jgi:hypothetical protein
MDNLQQCIVVHQALCCAGIAYIFPAECRCDETQVRGRMIGICSRTSAESDRRRLPQAKRPSSQHQTSPLEGFASPHNPMSVSWNTVGK